MEICSYNQHMLLLTSFIVYDLIPSYWVFQDLNTGTLSLLQKQGTNMLCMIDMV